MDCDEIIFSRHALMQMFARSISKDQVVEVIKNGEIITDYPDDNPYPSKLLLDFIDDEQPLHVVLGYDVDGSKCIVITAYQPDLKIWESDFKTRRKK